MTFGWINRWIQIELFVVRKSTRTFTFILWKTYIMLRCGSVAQSCPTLSNPMDCSTPGLPVHHQLPELTQTHVHWVGDAIQSSHPLLSPSPPASGSFLMSPLFTSDSQSIGISAPASVLPMNIQDWFLLGLTGLISMLSKGLSRFFSSPVWKHQFFSA